MKKEGTSCPCNPIEQWGVATYAAPDFHAIAHLPHILLPIICCIPLEVKGRKLLHNWNTEKTIIHTVNNVGVPI